MTPKLWITGCLVFCIGLVWGWGISAHYEQKARDEAETAYKIAVIGLKIELAQAKLDKDVQQITRNANKAVDRALAQTASDIRDANRVYRPLGGQSTLDRLMRPMELEQPKPVVKDSPAVAARKAHNAKVKAMVRKDPIFFWFYENFLEEPEPAPHRDHPPMPSPWE